MSTIHQGSIEERVKKILAEQLCRDADGIDLNVDLGDAHECDSLDVLEITMTTEDEFGIEIPDDDMWAFKTGQQIVDYVTAKVQP